MERTAEFAPLQLGRQQIARRLRRHPGLRTHVRTLLIDAYRDARHRLLGVMCSAACLPYMAIISVSHHTVPPVPPTSGGA
jgi:hypothetical protein